MAADIKALRDKAQSERNELEKRHADLQKKYATDKSSAAGAELRAVKQQIALKNEEHGELARMVALQAGGKNYRPQI